MLCPNGTVSKTVKYVLSLVFLVSVIAAAGVTIDKSDVNINFLAPDSANSDFLETQSAEYVYSYILQKKGIKFNKITVCTDKSENGGISINKIIVYSECQKEKILNAFSESGITCEVEVVNE